MVTRLQGARRPKSPVLDSTKACSEMTVAHQQGQEKQRREEQDGNPHEKPRGCFAYHLCPSLFCLSISVSCFHAHFIYISSPPLYLILRLRGKLLRHKNSHMSKSSRLGGTFRLFNATFALTCKNLRSMNAA